MSTFSNISVPLAAFFVRELDYLADSLLHLLLFRSISSALADFDLHCRHDVILIAFAMGRLMSQLVVFVM